MGISGGPIRTHEYGRISRFQFHDASAVLLDDGVVVQAVEGERLNRIKHSNKFPLEAIRFCLDGQGIKLQDLDFLAYYSEEATLKRVVEQWYMQGVLFGDKDFEEHRSANTLLQILLAEEFGVTFPSEKLIFVNHHQAHALSAFLPSGFRESLILTIDGEGDGESGRVMLGKDRSLEALARFPVSHSLGLLYVEIISVLGFKPFDEYKAMGLAPYGDPGTFRNIFKKMYTLLPDGEYALHWNEIRKINTVVQPRKQWEEFTADHKDIAAALQETLEEIVLHVLAHYKKKTNQRNLCLAGGVAHNCTLNGRILNSGMFDKVFVQPAAHDAGCAYGAALSVQVANSDKPVLPLRHLYWGGNIGNDQEIAELLSAWEGFLSFEKVEDVYERCTTLIAEGKILAWVQGRSEFGPRALGNRSILADPRPEENKAIVNAMVKKREAFRPFAPAVMSEYAEEFFEIDADDANLEFMVYVVKVRPDKRKILGAVTHVDGTARVQIVSRAVNHKFWHLLDAFNKRTGIPVLLNTSFNNNAEPIVESVTDAIVCFLTTQLDRLVVGDFIVTKTLASSGQFLQLVPSLPRHVTICQTKKMTRSGQPRISFECQVNYDSRLKQNLSATLFDILLRADGRTKLVDLMRDVDETKELLDELRGLWTRRLITLHPAVLAGAGPPVVR